MTEYPDSWPEEAAQPPPDDINDLLAEIRALAATLTPTMAPSMIAPGVRAMFHAQRFMMLLRVLDERLSAGAELPEAWRQHRQ